MLEWESFKRWDRGFLEAKKNSHDRNSFQRNIFIFLLMYMFPLSRRDKFVGLK